MTPTPPPRTWERIDEADGSVRFEIRAPVRMADAVRTGIATAFWTATAAVLSGTTVALWLLPGAFQGDRGGLWIGRFVCPVWAYVWIRCTVSQFRLLGWRVRGRETLVVAAGRIEARRRCLGIDDRRAMPNRPGTLVLLDRDPDWWFLSFGGMKRGNLGRAGVPRPNVGQVLLRNAARTVGVGLSMPREDAVALRDALLGLHGLREP